MNNEGVTVTGAEECPVDKFWGNGLGEKVVLDWPPKASTAGEAGAWKQGTEPNRQHPSGIQCSSRSMTMTWRKIS